jgi:cation diffusion facilitator family transporter
MARHAVVDNSPSVRRVLVLTLILNCAVALAKIIWGYVSGSIGMASDGFHSLFDGVSNVVGLAGIWIASRPPDKTHPYGHRKYETLFTIVISAMIFATCLQILRRVYSSFSGGPHAVVSDVSFAVMGVTIAVNLFVMTYEARKGRQLGSEFLVADAMHTRSDLMASLAVVTGLVFTKLGYRLADPMAGVLVTLLIARIGWQIIKHASDVLVDTTRIDIEAVRQVVNRVKGVRDCHEIRTRGHERHIFLDLHVLVDPRMTIKEAHDIAERVERTIKECFPEVADIVVHTEPDERPDYRLPSTEEGGGSPE